MYLMDLSHVINKLTTFDLQLDRCNDLAALILPIEKKHALGLK